MQAPAACSVRSQTAACPTSPPIDFLIPGLEGHHFVAWGAGEGLVDVGFFQVRTITFYPLSTQQIIGSFTSNS